MRLLTHNMLSSNIKGVTNGFPLRIEAEKVVEKQVDINHDFLRNIFPKIDWKALSDASRIMGFVELPEERPDPSALDSDLEFLRMFHHSLLELHLEEGALVCPETGRKFPVSKGIPNMLLHEDEV
ncbi:multifunctional methyltransferase subunit TRM112 homolog A-like [Hibiscus syriacus]|uniref:multifunctional methyltransferase subunit TRM112 homolog A-like n=1 Tax=Hibiscus syriacus TaxID=106335 RepID=UPI0019212655|nr:multifunctional methyltransferase subunit TRM112 homolog A-like [Hibiscus syriacus]